MKINSIVKTGIIIVQIAALLLVQIPSVRAELKLPCWQNPNVAPPNQICDCDGWFDCGEMKVYYDWEVCDGGNRDGYQECFPTRKDVGASYKCKATPDWGGIVACGVVATTCAAYCGTKCYLTRNWACVGCLVTCGASTYASCRYCSVVDCDVDERSKEPITREAFGSFGYPPEPCPAFAS